LTGVGANLRLGVARATASGCACFFLGDVMPYIIAEPCINVKDRSCVDVCPVDCIYEGPDMLYIHPDECIDCGACEPECPVTAIFPEEDTPPQWKSYIAKNRDVFQSENPPGKPQRKGA